MPYEQDKEALDSVDTKNAGLKSLADEATKRAVMIVAQCNRFKQPRLDQIQKYRDLYAGKVKRKYRQPFNVVIPTFAGAIDTLQADFNDDLALELEEVEPADFLAVQKLNALWNMEATSVAPNAMFAYKTRTDRSNALFTGRGFMMNYGVSDPDYMNCFETFELEDSIFQAQGGGIWENHLYRGRQNIVRSASDLQSYSVYNEAQVKKLLAKAARTDFYPTDDEASKGALAKFKAMGLSPTNADYVGEQLFKLVEMEITMRGQKYYLVFSPWYQEWVRFDRLKEVFSAEIMPMTSWATHEDNKNFLNKSYSDDMYGVADAVHTMFNQELTNREKSNNNPRAYDREMFPDVAKLDAAQYRPDALVPVDTKGGVRKIAEGIYSFETAQLSGTINLIEWINQTTGTSVGVTDLSMGGEQQVSKKATVAFAEQQNISKRLLLRSSPYTEAMGRIGKLFIQSAKDHLPAEKALKRLGIEGQGWDAVIRRTDLDLYGDVDVRIVSSALDMKNSQLKKEGRVAVLDKIGADPILAATVNPRWRAEQLLRTGDYDDADIKIGLDTKDYGNKEETAYAHQGIQEIQAGRKPDLFYGATTLFLQIVHDFAVNNRTTLGDRKYNALLDYVMAHQQIVQENMQRKAQADAAAISAQQPTDPTAPAVSPNAPVGGAPSPLTQVQRVVAQTP